MKKVIFTTLITILFSGFSSAQINKNTLMVGGSGSFSKSANGNGIESSSRITLTAGAGYFVLKNLALGTSFGFDRYGEHYNSWSITPFVRYYVKNIFAQVGYGFSKTSYYPSSPDYDYNRTVFKSELGYALFLNNNVAIEPAFFFNQYFNDGKNSGSNFGLKIGFQIYINRD